MPLSAWDGMQEAEVLLGRVSDTAVAAPWGPQEQGAHLTLGMVTLHMLSWAPSDLSTPLTLGIPGSPLTSLGVWGGERQPQC